jgi:hypothetical protein
MLIPVDIFSFAVDPSTHSPVIILKEQSGQRMLSITVGHLEASSIAIKSLNVTSERPLTIDLVKLTLEQLGGSLHRVIIYDLSGSTYLARLHIVQGASVHLVECRPSDAIALAMRCSAPIFVHDEVFAKSSTALSEKEKLQHNIASIDTLEFGTYYLE